MSHIIFICKSRIPSLLFQPLQVLAKLGVLVTIWLDLMENFIVSDFFGDLHNLQINPFINY
jgi:hypothetical protein